MEEEQEQQLKHKHHVCKFCSKSFSCGRSLGGHMRSHMINDITAQADGTKLTRKKLPSLVVTTTTAATTTNGGETSNYVLRENPKKTWRIPDDQETTSVLVERTTTCKECGKVFQSWKSLFGHMKCHSGDQDNKLMITEQHHQEEEEEEEEVEAEESWTSVMDIQSDNETVAAAVAVTNRKKKKRSLRRIRQANSSSSLCFANTNTNNNNNNASSSVTEIEQEQEEVAICLMMLSRDVTGMNNSVAAESSDNNNSVFVDKLTKTEPRKTEYFVFTSEISRKLTKKMKSIQQDDESVVVENSGIELGKRKLLDSFDPERNSRFECTTCNKIFHSYQALGGHRASHKKNKGCYASSENSIETTVQLSPDHHHPDESKPIIKSESPGFDTKKMSSSSSSKGHACPICYKVFPSGQALGGHKRSHLVVASNNNNNNIEANKNNQNLGIQEAIPIPITPPIRDFLDLNLPAPAEEDNNNNNGLLGFNQWWIASSHKHESLVGLIS